MNWNLIFGNETNVEFLFRMLEFINNKLEIYRGMFFYY